LGVTAYKQTGISSSIPLDVIDVLLVMRLFDDDRIRENSISKRAMVIEHSVAVAAAVVGIFSDLVLWPMVPVVEDFVILFLRDAGPQSR